MNEDITASRRRQELLKKLLDKKKVSGQQASIPPRVNIEAINKSIAPLSYVQQRMYFFESFEENSTVYSIPVACIIHGSLNISFLEASLKRVVQRHHILRTTFNVIDSEVCQVVNPDCELNITVVDLSAEDEQQQATKLHELIVAYSRTPFDLKKGPLLRVAVFKLSEVKNVLFFNVHHAVFDGLSGGILYKELMHFYQQHLQGAKVGAEELTIQYGDYAYWQKGAQADLLKKQLSYWKEQLSGELPVLRLPIDKPRPKIQTFNGGHYDHDLGSILSKRVKAYSSHNKVSLFMVLLAAFKVLLARYTGQKDIVVGTTVAGRNYPQIQNLIGCFINTLVLRTDLSQSSSFKGLLEQVRKVTTEAYANQDLPFDQLVDELQPQRDLAYSPLFQVMFVLNIFQGQAQASVGDTGLSFEPYELAPAVSPFDLTVDVSESDNGDLVVGFTYNQDLFEQASIVKFCKSYQLLLEGITEDIASDWFQLPVLPEQEESRLLQAWNNTQIDYPREQSMHQLFEQQAQDKPDAIAVVFDDTALTYRQLNEQANQLAHYLRDQGVKPNTLVGLCVERSLDMMVAVLGIFKAGGAYVPVDPHYPSDRIRLMLEDSNAEIVLTQSCLSDTLTELPEHVRTVALDEASVKTSLQQHSKETPQPLAEQAATNLAYVIYTSGSTGKPKGVMIEHRNLTNFLLSMAAKPGLSASDTLLAVTSLSFDIHTLELYLPLIRGSRVILASRADTASPDALAGLINTHGVNVMQATPATWQMLVDNDWQVTSSLKVLCGGEALSLALKDKLLSQPSIELWNMYGPTETTVWSAVKQIKPEETVVNIGPGIANTQLYVLGENLEVCPLNVPGELHIGGDGLARGYLNRPELTAERFIKNPLGRQPGGRLYKTGDLVRWLPNGELEFLGRIDQQVKIRGFRIELGEIETALLKHAHIGEAVVVVRSEQQTLIAYLVRSESDEPLDEADLTQALRAELKQQLPEYMVPAAFIILDTLPLTPNGKVDRKALAALSISSQLEANYVAPETEIEHKLAEIWSKLLNIDVEQISTATSFFELGGHSLLTLKLMAEINTAFGVSTNTKDIFLHDNISALALYIDKLAGANAEIEYAIVRQHGPIKVPGNHVVQSWWRETDKGLRSMSNGGEALRIDIEYDEKIVMQCLEYLYARHSIFRSVLFDQDGEAWLDIADDHKPAYEVYNFSQSENVKQEMHDLEVKIGDITYIGDGIAFDKLGRPPIKVVVAICQGHFYIRLYIDHTLADGFSTAIMSEELGILFKQALAGETLYLEENPYDYSDYLYWLHHHYKGSAEEKKAKDFWQEKGRQYKQTRLKHDFTDVTVARGTFKQIRFFLGSEISTEIESVSRKTGLTDANILFTLFNIFVCRFMEIDQPTLGTVMLGRYLVGSDKMVGITADVVFVPSPVTRDMSTEDALGKVNQLVADATIYSQTDYRDYMPYGIAPNDHREAKERIESAPFVFSYDAFANLTEEHIASISKGDVKSSKDMPGLVHYIWGRFSRTDNNIVCSLCYDGMFFSDDTIRDIMARVKSSFLTSLGVN